MHLDYIPVPTVREGRKADLQSKFGRNLRETCTGTDISITENRFKYKPYWSTVKATSDLRTRRATH